MYVAEIWRFPVKSMQGERVDVCEVNADGLSGDREYALFDADTGLGLTARRVPELLFGSARRRPDGVEITLPDGSVAAGDRQLSDWLGRSVVLRSTSEVVERRYEHPADFELEDDWMSLAGAKGAFHDSSRTNVSLVSTTTLGGWDRRRFRSNVVLAGAGEEGLVGSRVTIGDVVLKVGKHIERCVMTTRPQPGGLEKDLDVLRTIHRERGGCLAVGALVARPGTIRVGDEIEAVRGLRERVRSILV